MKYRSENYEFLAKQGQEEAVMQALRDMGLTPSSMEYRGTRGNHGGCDDPRHCEQYERHGIMIQTPIPVERTSKTKIDRRLKELGLY